MSYVRLMAFAYAMICGASVAQSPTDSAAPSTSLSDAEGAASDRAAFLGKMIVATTDTLCTYYGKAFHGYVIDPHLSISNEEQARIVKEVFQERKLKVDAKRLATNKADLGDTRCLVFAVFGVHLGEPATANTTIVKGKVVEQLVFKNGTYLYFDNGRLSAVQHRN